MRLFYVGTHQAVRVPLPFGGEVVVERGKSTNFPDTMAKRMLDQKTNWSKKGDKK